jgi:hypothetical protein
MKFTLIIVDEFKNIIGSEVSIIIIEFLSLQIIEFKLIISLIR